MPSIADDVLDLVGPLPHRTRRLPIIVVLVSLGVIAALFAIILHIVQPEERRHVASPTAVPISDYTLDPARFATIPSRSDAETTKIVADTGSGAPLQGRLSANEARKRNAATPAISDVGSPPKPFHIALADTLRYGRALDCMTAAIYYEAANEPLDGQRAVAQVVLNRTRHFAYPHTICGVVYQGWQRSTGCQFSFTCDGALGRIPVAALWARARGVASMALSGLVYAPVGLATHYHANYVVPYWASTLVKQATIGQHIFYRWPGAWGTLQSFAAPYDAAEPDTPGNVQVAAGDILPGAATRIAAPTDRPVLAAEGQSLPATLPLSGKAGEAEATRVYLMDRAPFPKEQATKAKPPSKMRGGVTGGVIMPGTALPTAPANGADAEKK